MSNKFKAVKAVFLDRDGTINRLCPTDKDPRRSPCFASEFELFPEAGKAIYLLNQAGWQVIIVSNQPGIAKGQTTPLHLFQINWKMIYLLRQDKARLDGIYYCFHHPDSDHPELCQDCSCRKPQPGLILQAAKQKNISLPDSFMIGDQTTDIQAGRAAGCQTILLEGGLKIEDIHRLCRRGGNKKIYVLGDLRRGDHQSHNLS